MCLILKVRVPITQPNSLAAAIATLPPEGLRVELEALPRLLPWLWVRRGKTTARVSETGGCACSVLADNADWDAPSWAMRPEVREPLGRTLETLAARVPDGMVVEALWSGDHPLREQVVTPAELGALARADGLGTRTRYYISPRG